MARLTNASLKNCSVLNSEPLPLSYDFINNIEDWSDAEAAMLWVCLGVTILTFGICIEGVVYLSRHIRHWSMRVQTAWQVALFGIFSVGSLFALMMPRSSSDIDNVMAFLFALCQYELLNLFFDNYLGGEYQIVKLYGATQTIDLSKLQQCTRCCKCLPNVPISKTSLQRIRITVFQSTIFHAISLIVTIILSDDDEYVVYENRGAFSSAPILTVVLAISKVLAVYGLYAASLVFPDEMRQQYKSQAKVQLLGLVVMFTQLQSLIIQLLLTSGVVVCNPRTGLSAGGRASYIHHICLIFEVLLLCLFARCAVWRVIVPEHEWLYDDVDVDMKPAVSVGTVDTTVTDVDNGDVQRDQKTPTSDN